MTAEQAHTTIVKISYSYRAMLYRARLGHSKSSVRPSICLSVRDVEVGVSHRLEYTSKIISRPNS